MLTVNKLTANPIAMNIPTMRPRRSSRFSRPAKLFGTQRVVFEGHGEWRGDFTKVPAGTQITIYTGLGSAIDDEIGIRIAKDQSLPSTIPDNGCDSQGDMTPL
jgi:hypothetical protein